MERKSWAQLANPGSPGKMATEYVALVITQYITVMWSETVGRRTRPI